MEKFQHPNNCAKNIIYGLNYHYSKSFPQRWRETRSGDVVWQNGWDRGWGRDETMAYSPGFYDTSWFMLLQKTNCFLFAASQSLFGSIYLRIWWQQQLQQFLDTMRNIVAAMAYRHGSRSTDLMVGLVWMCHGTAQHNRLLTTKTWVRMAVLKAGWIGFLN